MVRHSARLPALIALVLLTGACTVVRVDSDSDPARIESRGLINGHAAVGIPSEEHLIHLDLFDGTSDGAIAEIVIWKLFRFELGAAGASIGVGPFSLGLGILFYDAETPSMESQRSESSRVQRSGDGVTEEVTEATAPAD